MISLILEDDEATALSVLLMSVLEEGEGADEFRAKWRLIKDKLETERVSTSADLYLYEVNTEFAEYAPKVLENVPVETQARFDFNETGYRANPIRAERT